MAFEKKPYTHLYPVLSDYEDDTDIQLEQVKQLSLKTAAEDDERRRSKLAREVHNSVVSSVSQGIHASNSLPELLRDSEKKAFSNTFDRVVPDLGDRTVSMPISRPRPQAGNPTSQRFVPVQPVTTPSATVTTVPPPLPVIGPNASLNRSANCTIGSSLQQSKPEIPPRPIQYNVPYSSSQSVSPPFGKSALEMGSQISTPNRIIAKDNDAPLINLSPPCLVSALGDFDLNDLDPFWRPTARIPTNPSVSNVLANQANTKINTTSLSSVLPQQLPNAAYAKSNVPSSVSVSVQVKPSTTYNMSNPLPSASVQLQQTTSNRSIPAVSRASPHVGLTESQMYGLMWPVAPTYGWNWSNGMPVCAAPKTEVPQFQSGFKTRVGDMPTGSLARSPILGQDDRNSNQAGKGIQDAVETLTNSSSLPSNIDANRSPSSAGFGDVNSPSADNSSRRMLVTGSGGSSDLMYFTSDPELEPQFISLQDFDPLYSPECEVCAHCQCFETETDELFSSASKPSPYHPYEVRKASNSFQPALSNTANSKVIATPLPMHQSIDELQDPFSIHDLTVSLEKKRQRHAMEQEARAKQQEPSSVPKPALSRLISHKTKPKESAYEMLEDFNETADGEIRAFLDMVKRIKSQYSDGNSNTNPGFVVSPRTSRKCDPKMSVKIIVSGRFITEPVIFTCDVNTIVAHVISHVLLSLTDDLGSASVDNFLLKVYGLSEYLTNDSVLNQYEYVQQCLKLDRDISFIIVENDSVSRSFKRTAEDMQCPPFVRKMRPAEDPKYHITKDKLNLLMETFYKEVEKLRDAAIQGLADSASPCGGVVQAVKAICMVLNQIETLDISRAVKRLVDLVKGGGQQSDSYVHVSEDSEGIHRVRVYYPSRSESSLSIDDLHIALEDVTKYVKTLIDMYCRTFHTEFRFPTFSSSPQVETTDITKLRESLLIYIASAHQLPLEWKNIYTEYFIVCSVFHGGQRLSVDISSDPKQMSTDGFPGTIVWDNWLTFESIPMSSLPRESRLCLTLIGVRVVPATTNESSHRVNVPLGWVVMQIYNQQFELVQGSQLLCLWPNNIANPLGTNSSNTDSSKAVLIQVNLPDFDNTYIFPSIPEPLPSLKQDFRSLHPDDQEYLQAIIEKDALTRLTEEEGDYLWEKRYYLLDLPAALPRIIQTVNSWSWFALRETYTMIREWASMPPLESLQLLLPTYPDTYVRNKAVDQLKELSPDDLYDLLPQLVQALKFECYHTSALARMLLEKATTNVRFAHFLYWLLKEAADDDHYRKRFHLMFGGLLSIVGEKMRSELSKQEDFVRVLSSIADKVKAGRDKEAVLQRELGNMWEFYNQSNVRIPLNPSLEVTGLDVKSCSYFTSFTCPLKLALKNVDSSAGNSYIMFKAGDDLRQDMLTMQLIRIMDKLWLNEGLDLKMVTFNCQPTGLKRGIVELVMESDTLRKIQVKHGHGLAGSFKDRTIADWLQVHNPTELDYQKAVDNFTASCAGYCVATYVLGICDRHNDNIMIKHSGHIFHIDFAKFLGDAQTFGNFKRDRTPFVLTSDMAYVINGGDKPSERFQYFVDLCCQAFNIIRRNGNLFMNLFSLMIRSGIPGVNANAPKHIQRVLLPDRTDVEAVAEFTRMINKCLQSIFTQVNFFIHNLAQVKFSGPDDGTLLSFVPKTYTINTDGRIRSLEMYGIQKRYSPEKHYVYIVRVERENQRVFSFVMRRYSEFQELHRKLVMTFPLVHLPSLSGRVILGRAHVRAVAEARKEELQAFLRHLLTFSQEVAQHDLIYTFFHPMLKDEQDFDKTDVLKLRDNPDQQSRLNLRRVDGSVKVNLFYKSGEMTVMIMHVKDLSPTSSGEAPNPYVKLYLLPDPTKLTKKKTKITKNSYNPTYNEMFMYRLPLENLKSRTLQILVCSYDTLKENEFLGAIHLPLSEIDWTRADCTAWYRLQTLHVM